MKDGEAAADRGSAATENALWCHGPGAGFQRVVPVSLAQPVRSDRGRVRASALCCERVVEREWVVVRAPVIAFLLCSCGNSA